MRERVENLIGWWGVFVFVIAIIFLMVLACKKANERFEQRPDRFCIEENRHGCIYLITDTETGVEYLCKDQCITPVYDKNGKLKINDTICEKEAL